MYSTTLKLTQVQATQFFKRSSQTLLKSHIEQSEQWFFLYGQESTRKRLRRQLAYLFRQRRADDRTFYHTIDSINNNLGIFWLQRLSHPMLAHVFCEPLSIRQKNFVKAHYQRVLEKVTTQDITGIDDVLKIACTTALEEAYEHDIKIFFSLDGIDWDKLCTTYKQSVTTEELMTIYRLTKLGQPLANVTFIEAGEVISLPAVMERISIAMREDSAMHSLPKSRVMAH